MRLAAQLAQRRRRSVNQLAASGYYYSAQQSGPVALLFPGQGSQYVGMGADIPQLLRGRVVALGDCSGRAR